MNKQRITTKQLALCSVLLTLMLVLGWVESLFPPLLGVPGIKLGLSNGVLIFAVYMLSLPTAWVLMLLKVVLSSLFWAAWRRCRTHWQAVCCRWQACVSFRA